MSSFPFSTEDHDKKNYTYKYTFDMQGEQNKPIWRGDEWGATLEIDAAD